ncbi:MAG: carboxypeptidase regulatory-like domain-containing protein [Rhodocyclaceae bacterium]|nr:carboxypeptidase regulatory-like domain-containing protein [Rhodocyclaceae bacterium]
MKLKQNRAGRIAAALGVLLATSLPATGLQAAGLHGKVVDTRGAPVAGAIVSLANGKGRTESVWSGADGSFSLDTGMRGKLALRVRKRFYEDAVQPMKSGQPVTIRLAQITDPQRLSDDHPALSRFSRIQFESDESSPFSRRNFTRDCLSCHSLGGAFTRTPRPPEGWMPTVQRMHGYVGSQDPAMIDRRAHLLSRAFDDTPLTSRPQIPYDPLVGASKLYQWALNGSSVPHDAEVSARTGKVYISDLFAGGVFELDLVSDKMTFAKEPDDGMPPGGGFAKAGLTPPFGLTLPHGPHSLAEAENGKLYLTDAIGSTLVEYDPTAKTFKHFDTGKGTLYPHTVRIAADGIVWFTLFASNQIGRFDPATKEMKVIDLPAQTRNAGLFVAPLPYGIDINPKDGSIWYAHFGNDTIGRVDPKTFEIREIDSPVHAPRRQRFDASGALWIAGFADGAIARFDPQSGQSKLYPLPTFAPNEIPAPYALAVNPLTQEVWVNDTALDVVWRFLPKEERFVAYPLPLKGSYTRDFSFTKQGWACSSNNPLPAASLEGFVPELICIDPHGAKAATKKKG